MTAFSLKIIAITTMLIDHLGYIIFGKITFFNYIGRIAFPIFAFQISEGYIHTKNLKNYFLRLFFFAVISQIPFMLFYSIISEKICLNIFCTLFLGLLSIYIYDKCKYKELTLTLVIIIASIAEVTNCDYGFYGVLVILIFYIFKKSIFKASTIFIIFTVFKYAFNIEHSGLFIATSLACIFLALYNGEKGKDIKYLQYAFYPIHLILLYIIHCILK